MEGNDWDLFAVVRGCREKKCSASPSASASLYVSTTQVEMNPFPDASSSRRSGRFEELEEFFRPFFSNPQPPPPPPHKPLTAAAASMEPTTRARLPRRRRPPQKKVVCQVPADSVSSDVWAWRKYGQKPIKGSPYPRGYYRCSSSKGCLARKQMERSRTDPGTFIITYTAEHNHPVPTHRNSLAGSTRHKLPSPPPPPPTAAAAAAAAERSPTTSLTASASIEEEEEEEGMLLVEDMEVIGEDDFLIVGGVAAAAANASSKSLSAFDDDDRFFADPWLSSTNSSSNAAAAAGGN